ncbi:alpha/beta hydrolase [Aspergillus clavatus NRRL 1]|uniref:Alpha/beta superfamily hydrolase, putative n=1 Tax=Aspergillus clavatus (strain ATCC 1007 / CBS 513.65 / DSM 816 / NCTC 3887 / NRRL 1 / QM 1276 / 107) TaxID=344612 RepID=A1CCP3_ASPCL|nr:alpha/beta superfamily hydrolase, putative [Aspergillus clavatus NRRL 1]EAW12300.1 alpha/beta superfamily hydrolase, putative [Aspergillus clavatus NRRL 1]
MPALSGLKRIQRNAHRTSPLESLLGPSPASHKCQNGASRPIHTIISKQRTRKLTDHKVRSPSRRATSRGLLTSAIPTALIPPLIFTTLLLGLWTWKCFWIVLMQNKLLYIAWLPPFARSEQIADYASECRPVTWTQKPIRSLDGTTLAVCEGRIRAPVSAPAGRQGTHPTKRVVICYFQGNGGSTPMRLPLLSGLLRDMAAASRDAGVECVAVALSYRGYWTSAGRATQSGIELDAQAFLDWAVGEYSVPGMELQVVLWGHSLGSAIASTALATYLSRRGLESPRRGEGDVIAPITGLILEAPVSSTKDMLISLYPQKWLPYRYLWPFLWNNWNSAVAMQRMARWRDQLRQPGKTDASINGGPEVASDSAGRVPPILLLSAEKDEVIPSYAAVELEEEGIRLGLDVQRLEVAGAMHTEIPIKMAGKKTMVEFILSCTKA